MARIVMDRSDGGQIESTSLVTEKHMPMYDYKCLECGKESLVAITLKEHESG